MGSFDSIGNRLRMERQRLQLSQAQLASAVAARDSAGGTRQAVSLYEKDKRTPGGAFFQAVSELGFDVRWVITGERGEAGNEAVPSAATPPSYSRLRQAALLDFAVHHAGEPIAKYSLDVRATEAARAAAIEEQLDRLRALAIDCGEEQRGLLLGVAEQLRAASAAASRPAPAQTPPNAPPPKGATPP